MLIQQWVPPLKMKLWEKIVQELFTCRWERGPGPRKTMKDVRRQQARAGLLKARNLTEQRALVGQDLTELLENQ